jgi:uncharacterized membrane protein required for colicin V production
MFLTEKREGAKMCAAVLFFLLLLYILGVFSYYFVRQVLIKMGFGNFGRFVVWADVSIVCTLLYQ